MLRSLMGTALATATLATSSPVVAAEPGRCTVFRDVTLIDGTGAPARLHATVVAEADRITWVGAAASAPAHVRCTVVDGAGRFLLPGLADLHVHLSKFGETALPLSVLHGVTSVRDMGSDLDEVARWRQEIRAGQRLGPRIKTPGPILESAANLERMLSEQVVEPVARTRVGLATPAEAERAVETLARRGADFIKVRTSASREVYLAIGAAARRTGLRLAAHSDRLTPDDILEAGQASIEHPLLGGLTGLSDADRLAAFARLAAAGVVLVPTLGNFRDSLAVPVARAEAMVADPLGEIDPRRRFVSKNLLADWREQVEERRGPGPDWSTLVPAVLRNLKEMRRSGLRMLPGTDIAVLLKYPGSSLLDELEQMGELLEITPMEVIVSATRQAAELMGTERELGTVEVGKLADLVLLDGDPLQSLANTRRIAGILVAGRYIDRTERSRLLETLKR